MYKKHRLRVTGFLRFYPRCLIPVMAVLGGCANDPALIPPYRPETAESLVVHFIDVGQGDAALLEWGGCFVLVDGGDADHGDTVAAYLERRRVDTLDLVLLSHADEDHYGGLPPVFKRFPVKKWGHSGLEPDKATYRALTALIRDTLAAIPEAIITKGASFTWQGLTLAVLFPEVPFLTGKDSLNDNSVVCRVTWEQWAFLFTGDITARAETVLTRTADINLAAQVLKVPHHGSGYSSTLPFLEKAAPRYAVISCGADNPYGHPQAATLARLEQGGATVYRTDTQGTIVFNCRTTAILIDYR